ncbi:MAG TPA: erythromycin esterase family protein [Deinococcales bacterium]|nr:erythromycin esterase family protein [Deinococcales bacterium]
MRFSALILAGCLAVPVLAQVIPGGGEPRVPAGLVEALRANATPITGSERDYDPLVRMAREARIVLIGESTHGTAEFYRERARITKRLIEEAGFDAVVVEAEWPETDRVDRWVRGRETADRTAEQALSDFQAFPPWVWRNEQVRDFVTWLRDRNARLPAGERAGFHGMDMQRHEAAAAAVVRYLEGVNKDAAARARKAYQCNGSSAAQATDGCAAQEASVLADVRATLGANPSDAAFSAERSALVAQAAEAYGRLFDPTESWNVRDRFMLGVVNALLARYTRGGQPGRVVVWAHNSHVGDARASELGAGGEVTLGQLAREQHGRAAVLVGQTTVRGTVLAAPDWDKPARVHALRPALPNSIAAVMSAASPRAHLVVIRGRPELMQRLRSPLLERAVGVVYLPVTERQSHYFLARPGERWDALIHIPETTANKPLPATPGASGNPPVTAGSRAGR